MTLKAPTGEVLGGDLEEGVCGGVEQHLLEEELFLQPMVIAGLSQMVLSLNAGSELRCAVSLLKRTQKYQFST